MYKTFVNKKNALNKFEAYIMNEIYNNEGKLEGYVVTYDSYGHTVDGAIILLEDYKVI